MTTNQITIGLITTITGPGSAQYKNTIPAAEARIDLQNAKGGVDGRKIKVITEDDQSTPSGNQLASQAMLAKNVFGVMDLSPLLIGGYKVLQQAGVPVTGGGTEDPVWFTQPDTNMFAFDQASPHYPANTSEPKFFKSRGATKVASIGYTTPSASSAAKADAIGVQKEGLTSCYLNTSVPYGGVQAAPIALAMKQAGCTGVILDMEAATNFAILTAAKQAGVPLKVAISATGYGQTLLTTSSALQAGQGAYFPSTGVPVELHTKATEQFQAALAKYAHFTGVPSYAWYVGWLSADLMIKGLEVAGKNPTRASFINNLRKVSKYTGTGLATYPANFTLQAFGKPPKEVCSYYMQLKGKAFVPVPSTGKPICGVTLPGTTQVP